MTANDIQATIKRELKEYLPKNKESNAAVWECTKSIFQDVKKFVKTAVEEEQKKAPVESTDSSITLNKRVQEFLDNPMPPEQEARTMRALFQAQLASGELSGQMMTAFEKIIGVSSGNDESIQTVDFSEAFPDLDLAVKITKKMLEQT